MVEHRAGAKLTRTTSSSTSTSSQKPARLSKKRPSSLKLQKSSSGLFSSNNRLSPHEQPFLGDKEILLTDADYAFVQRDGSVDLGAGEDVAINQQDDEKDEDAETSILHIKNEAMDESEVARDEEIRDSHRGGKKLPDIPKEELSKTSTSLMTLPRDSKPEQVADAGANKTHEAETRGIEPSRE